MPRKTVSYSLVPSPLSNGSSMAVLSAATSGRESLGDFVFGGESDDFRDVIRLEASEQIGESGLHVGEGDRLIPQALAEVE